MMKPTQRGIIFNSFYLNLFHASISFLPVCLIYIILMRPFWIDLFYTNRTGNQDNSKLFQKMILFWNLHRKLVLLIFPIELFKTSFQEESSQKIYLFHLFW